MLRNSNKSYILILVGILLFGSYLRLYNLDRPSFWVDELDFVEAAKSMLEVGEPLLRSGHPYPRAPLFTYSLMPVFKVFGISEFSSRLSSALFGILSLLFIYVIGQRFFNARVGLIASLFLACAPLSIGLSRICRMYTLFHILFLVGFYLFFLGFEAQEVEKTRTNHQQIASAVTKIQQFLDVWQINVLYLFLGGIFLLCSYFTHPVTGLFLVSFLSYLLIFLFYYAVKEGPLAALRTKYVLFFIITMLAFLSFLLIPFVREFLNSAVSYLPKWAEDPSMQQNRWRIFTFLFNRRHLPVNLLFILGTLIVIRRGHKAGIYAILNLFIPCLIFSLVFQYRKNDYISHVYPLFLLIAALGLDYLIELLIRLTDLPALKKLLAGLRIFKIRELAILFLCLAWLPLMPEFRFGQGIPRRPDGTFNGAIWHNEWKEASVYMQNKLCNGDVLISTLPLTLQYYLGKCEYTLNSTYADMAKKEGLFSAQGRPIDFYSGTEVIENLVELKSILTKHPKGWLLVDRHRFSTSVYVPRDIHEYVSNRMILSLKTKRKTVLVYRWDRTKQVLATKQGQPTKHTYPEYHQKPLPPPTFPFERRLF